MNVQMNLPGGWMRSSEIILFITEYDLAFNTLITVP